MAKESQDSLAVSLPHVQGSQKPRQLWDWSRSNGPLERVGHEELDQG